jgi:4-amino-4-deoxy-L-arabinose transferase-like glycosyltransferase
MHVLQAVHPPPKFDGVGFDEGLYRGYVNDLNRVGIMSYPDLAERYVAVQSTLPAAILPPTRFLYVFAAYLWSLVSGAAALTALRDVSSLFSILLLFLATAFAWRAGGPRIGICVAALMACAPTQIHMGQHALIDGFFAFWATLCLWLLWENLRRPSSWPWLSCYTIALALLVLTKENAMFAYVGLLAILALNYWLQFGVITRPLVLLTGVGPLLGAAILVNLCGSVATTYQIYSLLVSKASVLPYAIATGDGPWYRYLVDLMVMSPVVLVLAIGAIFSLKTTDKAALYLLGFVVGSYSLMANVRYGMNLRYANMWDMPLRYLATICMSNLSGAFGKRANWWLGIFVAVASLIELRQYLVFFVNYPLYELVTGGLLHAVKILK